MKVVIVGAGAIGLLYGLRLARHRKAAITLLTRTLEQARMLREQGGILLEGCEQHSIAVTSDSLEQYAQARHSLTKEDWIVAAVKQTHMEDSLLEQIGQMATAGCQVLALQNGIGHMERLSTYVAHSQLWVAVTTEGALRRAPNEVEHTGQGELYLYPYRLQQQSQLAVSLLELLKNAGITATLTNNIEEIQQRIYSKLLINCVINPLTAIFGVRNGLLPADAHRLQLMRQLHDECVTILRQLAISIRDDSWEQVLLVCERTAANESSMLADIKAGRKTEIQTINGSLVAMAEHAGMAAPLNKAVLTIVQAM